MARWRHEEAHMQRNLVLAGMAGLIVIVTARLGLSESLGAHPFWAVTTGYVGAAVGSVAGLALSRLKARTVVAAGGFVAGMGLLAAKAGAARFAASYAEDALAGRLWYFGWIGAAAGLALLSHAVLRAAFGAGR